MRRNIVCGWSGERERRVWMQEFQFICHHSPLVQHLIFVVCLFDYAHSEVNWIYLKMTAHRTKCTQIIVKQEKIEKKSFRQRSSTIAIDYSFIIQHSNGKNGFSAKWNTRRKNHHHTRRRRHFRRPKQMEQMRSIRMKTLFLVPSVFVSRALTFFFFFFSRCLPCAYGTFDVLGNIQWSGFRLQSH